MMKKEEQDALEKLPDRVTIYTAWDRELFDEYCTDDDDEWDPGFDYEWTLDRGKAEFIAFECMREEALVVSVRVPKSAIYAFFPTVYETYELIAFANRCGRKRYKMVTRKPTRLLEKFRRGIKENFSAHWLLEKMKNKSLD